MTQEKESKRLGVPGVCAHYEVPIPSDTWKTVVAAEWVRGLANRLPEAVPKLPRSQSRWTDVAPVSDDDCGDDICNDGSSGKLDELLKTAQLPRLVGASGCSRVSPASKVSATPIRMAAPRARPVLTLSEAPP